MQEYDDNDPAVIAAKAEARVRVLEARAKLHPAAQVVGTIGEKIHNIIGAIGCLTIILIIVVSQVAPQLFTTFFGR